MTNELSFPHTPPGPKGPRGSGEGCPNPEMLSAYLDGKLDATLRGPLEDHISRCEDCYFVVKETGALWAETAAAGSSLGKADAPERGAAAAAQANPGRHSADFAIAARSEVGTRTARSVPTPSPRRPKRWLAGRYFLPVAATIVVAAGSLSWWKTSHSADQYAASIRPLVEAVGERRLVEARLTGGFKFGPLIGTKRGADASDRERWGVLASAAEIKQRVDKAPTPANRRALAAAELFMGETDAAVSLLEQLARESPRDAGVQSDLGAAYTSRALRAGRADDWPRALEAAEIAIQLDPGLPESLFNRANALEEMSLWSEAEKAWRDYLATTLAAPDGWAGEARARLERLGQRPSSELEHRKQKISAALLSGDQNRLDQEVALAPDAGVEVFDDFLVDDAVGDTDWAERVSALRHALAASPARLAFPREPVQARDRPEFRLYGRARLHYKKLEWRAARIELSEFKSRRRSVLEPLSLWASVYIAAIDFQAGKTAEADSALQVLDRQSFGGPLFLGRVVWVRGMIALRSGRYDVAADDYSRAAAFFVEANDPGDSSVMAVAAGELLDRLGLAAQSWEQAMLGLRNRGAGRRLRSSALLLRTAELAWANGSPRAAVAFTREAADLVRSGDPVGDRVVVERTLARILLRDHPEEASRRLATARALAKTEPDIIVRAQLNRELDRLDAERQFASQAPEFESTVTRVLDDLSKQGARGREADLLALRGAWRCRRGAVLLGEADLAEALRIFEMNAAPSGVARAAYHHSAWKAFEEMIAARAQAGRHLEALALVQRSLRFLRGSEDRREVSASTLKEMIDQIPSRRAMLVLVPTQRRLHAWVLKRGRVDYSYQDLGSSELEAEVDSFIRTLEGGAAAAVVRASGNGLFKRLLDPSLAAIGDVEEVQVVSHRFLSRVPFHALWDSKTSRYWGQTASITMGSSLRSPALAMAGPWRGISILAVDEGSGAAALPGARAEATAIASLYPDPKLLIGNGVTASSLLEALRTSSIVHFAGHAQSSEAYPDLASLLVTDGQGGSQAFLARSISGLRLSGLALVVLASCASIQSSQTLDHGMMTVAGHFLNAGAGGVLGALWDVDDEDARAFMVRFHRSLARSLNPVAALAAARSASMEAGEDPKRWAAFALAME